MIPLSEPALTTLTVSNSVKFSAVVAE